MINKTHILAASLSIALLTGCSAATQPKAPQTGSAPDRPLNAETIDISDLSLSPFPAYANEGWAWQLMSSTSSSKRIMRLGFSTLQSEKLSTTPLLEQRGIAFDIHPDIAAVVSNITSTTIVLYLNTEKTRLPIYASYFNPTSMSVRIVATPEGQPTPCDDEFGLGFPFIMSSLRFEKTRPVRFGGISFDHAIETMRSKETTETYDFYRAFHNGLCISIMKTIDTGNLNAAKGEGVKSDFEQLLNSLRFF